MYIDGKCGNCGSMNVSFNYFDADEHNKGFQEFTCRDCGATTYQTFVYTITGQEVATVEEAEMPDIMKILEQFKARDDLNVEEINRRYLVVRKAITDVTGGSAMSGKITCPLCGKSGSLIFTQYSNGHVHATCTEGCIDFIE